jgi:RNA polymerase sigma-70 factor, ECF subfamily
MVSVTGSANIPDPLLRHAGDRNLVARILEGDPSAWRKFVLVHQRLVRDRVADVSWAFGRGEDDAAINDATSEVFAALVLQGAAPLRAFQGRSSLATYVAVLATRSATRFFARNRFVMPHEESGDPENHVAAATDQAHQRRIESLVDRLPPKERSVFSLFHLQGQSFAQISHKLEMPISIVGPTLRHAETQLRQWIEESA